ncbi:DUF805 domain-containing protein [Bacteroides sp. 51]|uniref:DUF805 domain-containing protein n=1 Tax=Bacteroides sp. 51 TaxID=2302938 RepID=UPI0013D28910|nr:DUF805 domain-containing protein [Bacteroides sp. 51]NDV83912.1 DUF805 domain-containing protein [Bacteroides sp. 51]
MEKAQNIYKYKTPKSGNDEVSYFLTKGRVRRRSFFLRLFFAISLLIISNFIMGFYAFPEYLRWLEIGGGEVRNKTFLITYNIFEVFNNIILPVLSIIFVLIQGAKRMHDTNKSGWYFLLPVYNILITFIPGTNGQNNYGIDPRPQKVVQYFDQMKNKK